MLDHLRECAGRWELTGVINEGVIRCNVCGAVHAASAVNTTAAFEDNYLGARMRELAAEGEALLAEDRAGRPKDYFL